MSRIDLLLVVDNSRSMGDKQDVLSLAVPDLVEGLTNPRCVLEDGADAPAQPSSGLEACPDPASTRVFAPIDDIHIGVISSSLGSGGADTCVPGMNGADPSVDDDGRLIDRSQTGSTSGAVPTYQGLGFLAWDPDPDAPSHEPPGVGDPSALSSNLQALIGGAGEVGCGFEAPLEAWYRFLVEPNPHAAVELQGANAILVGTDEELLSQRAAFLRSDSLLGIIMLSDENDCSARAGERFYFMAQSGSGQFRLPRARAVCATAPNDPCCRSCGEDPGPGCDTSQDQCDSPNLPPEEDQLNVRCFDQKRRFGIDFLHPVERYVEGLSSLDVADRDGSIVRNPVFSDLDPTDGSDIIRVPGQVFLAGIVGVPWQDVARRDANGVPDLLAGLTASGRPAGGLQRADELEANGTWDLILGDPANGIPPADPLMRESIDPRSGTHPPTAASLVPPNQSGNVGPVPNGSEYTIANRDDLQYACAFTLPAPRDCTQPGEVCDCDDDCTTAGPLNDNPLCTDPIGIGEDYRCTQYRAKAYPGIRQLSVLRGLGTQNVVASICPAQLTDPSLDSFGYRPAVSAVVETLGAPLAGCLAEPLPTAGGATSCRLFEVRTSSGSCEATCSGPGRAPVNDADSTVQAVRRDAMINPADCVCELIQLTGGELGVCQTSPDPTPGVGGWCYIDPAAGIGSGELVQPCSRNVRYVGAGAPAPGSTLVVACPHAGLGPDAG